LDTRAPEEVPVRDPALGRAWTALAIALLVHVTDEAATGFLTVYNPTVLALRERMPGLPLPVFRFDVWLAGLLALVVLLLLLRRPLLRGARWMRIAATAFAVLMIVNALGHVAGTIAGRTFDTVAFARPMPGFWSSPFLAAASLWVLARLRYSAVIQKSRG
jgi:hypothetical protein